MTELEEKKSFVLYADLISVVEKLILKDRADKTNHAGELFFAILKHVNDIELIDIDFVVELALEPIKNQLKRDLKKYNKTVAKRSEAGNLGNLKRYNPEIYKKVQGKEITLNEGLELAKTRKTSQSDKIVANVAVNDNDNDNVNVNDNVIIDKSINNKKEIDVDAIFEKYKISYKKYASELIQSNSDLQDLNRLHKISNNQEVIKPTIRKYLLLFLGSLNLSQEKHENKGKFTSHFSNWLRKQEIQIVHKPKEKIRYA